MPSLFTSFTSPIFAARRRHRSRRGAVGAVLIAAAAAAAVFAGAPLPAARAQQTAPAKAPKPPAEDSEVKMGREAHEELLRSGAKLIRDPAIAERVERIGKKIALAANATPLPATFGSSRHVPYEYRFFVVDDKEVNAYSLPGGYIYVTKGLYDYVQSDDELAGVLGHEIMHAAHHHVVRLQKEASRLNTAMLIAALGAMLSGSSDAMNVVGGLQFLAIQKVNGHSQNAEKDADHGGVQLAKISGYNPVGALTVMERFARDEKRRPEIEQGIFRTHPPSRERADAMVAQITGLGLPINRRDVTGALRVATQPVQNSAGSTDVLLDGKLLYRAASPGRAKQAADAINRLLDQNLQIYDVKKTGAQVIARGQTIVDAQPDDARLSPGATPESVADQAWRVLRNALYKQSLNDAF